MCVAIDPLQRMHSGVEYSVQRVRWFKSEKLIDFGVYSTWLHD